MRYEVIEHRVWLRDDGRTASIYGACPWTTKAEAVRWRIVARGWTVRDNRTNTVGMGRKPFDSEDEAEAFVATLS